MNARDVISNISRLLKRRPTIFVGVLFALVLSVALFLNANKALLTETGIMLWPFDVTLGPVSEAFYTSFLASLWQDIFFFLVIGLVSLFLFYRDPRGDEISTKLWYIYSGQHRSRWAMEFKEKIVRKLGCYVKTGRITLQITEYNKTLDAYRVHVKYDSTLVNTFANDSYDDEIKISFYPDDIDIPDGSLLGVAEELKIGRFSSNNDLEWDHLLKEPISYDTYQREYWETYEFSIHPDEKVLYHYSYWQWSKVGDDFVLGSHRFCRELEVLVQSSCPGGHVVDVETRFPDKNVSGNWRDDGDPFQLKKQNPSVMLTPPLTNVEPGQRVVLKLKPCEGA